MNKKPKIPKPTEAELEILAVLWEYGPNTVRFVNEKLNEKKRVGYTTTLKFLQIMTDKGMVSRDVDSRTHIYTALLREEKVRTQLLDKLLDTAFGGSASKLVMQALGNYNSSNEELEEIKKLIKKLEGGRK